MTALSSLPDDVFCKLASRVLISNDHTQPRTLNYQAINFADSRESFLGSSMTFDGAKTRKCSKKSRHLVSQVRSSIEKPISDTVQDALPLYKYSVKNS